MEITEEMCCKLLGRGVFYTDKDGRQRHGVLKSISRDRGIPYAEIKVKVQVTFYLLQFKEILYCREKATTLGIQEILSGLATCFLQISPN